MKFSVEMITVILIIFLDEEVLILHFSLAMKPDDLWKELKCVFEQAHQLQKANVETSATFLHVPHVTVSVLYY